MQDVANFIMKTAWAKYIPHGTLLYACQAIFGRDKPFNIPYLSDWEK